MSNIKLDLSAFQHVSSDDKSTTLKHKDGHELRLAHNVLSKDNKKQLEALRNSKKDIEAKKPSEIKAKSAAEGVKKANEEKDSKPYGSTVVVDKEQKYAEGGEARLEGSVLNEPSSEESAKSGFDALAESERSLSQDPATAGMTPVDPATVSTAGVMPGSEMAPDINKTIEAQLVQPQAEQAPAASEGLAQAAQQPAEHNPMMQAEDLMQQGYQKQMSGIDAAAKAQGELGKQQAEMYAKNIEAQQTAKSQYDAQFKALEEERQAHLQDIRDGYVDPNKYWTGDKNGNGSHSKIAAGIGMILAGFNPTSNPNAAINFLKHQMEMNLEAQKQNLGAKQNLLTANLRQFGNIKDAMDMTRLMQHDVLNNQLLQAAATAQTPMAKAAALQAAGKLQMDYAPLQQQFAMRRAMTELAKGGVNGDPTDTRAAEQMIAYARMTNPEMAKEMESRLVPGVGMAKLPIPTEARTELIGKQNFDKMANHYLDWVKKNAGSLNPAKIKEGATMAAELQGAYRNAIKGGVYKEGEQAFIEKLIPSNPAQFAASIRTLPKVEQLIQSNQSQLNSLKHGYGLPVKQQKAAQSSANPQQALAWAKANPQDPRAAKILKALGR